MTRVAQVIGKLNSAGVESIVNSYYRHMSRYQFDYFIDSDSAYLYSKEMKKLGARYYVVPPTNKLIQRIKELENIFRENNYSIVHSHMNTLNAPVLYAAKKAGVPVRISHNHSMADNHDLKNYLLKMIIKPTGKWFATDYMACGEKAGKWLFGNKAYNNREVFLLPNAIDVDKFKFDYFTRRRIRKELGIENAYVIGHVGRFVPQKNHAFLIKVFYELKKKKPSAELILIGDGPLKNQIESMVNEKGIRKAVHFLGNIENVKDYYSAMDVFMLPSLYEGVPVVGIEAQANNLPCLFSINISEETRIGRMSQFLPFTTDKWIEAIDQIALTKDRENESSLIRGSIFDLNISGAILESFYDSKKMDGNSKRL